MSISAHDDCVRLVSDQEQGLGQCEQRIMERRSIGRHLGFNIFANPAWDMILDLYRSLLSGHEVSISSLALASNVPPTTARRSIAAMVKADLALYQPDPSDRRRIYVKITPTGVQALRRVFHDMD